MNEEMKRNVLKSLECHNNDVDFTELEKFVDELSKIKPASIERDSIYKIDSNSIFQIDKLNWKNITVTSSSLMLCLSDFVERICTNPKAYAGRYLIQAWRLFSVCLFAVLDERLVQASSLIDSCIRLGAFSYCTNGCTGHCYEGMNLLIFQKSSNEKFIHSNSKKKNSLSSLSDIYESLSKNCEKCSSLDMDNTVFPCYDALKHILDPKSLLFPLFIKPSKVFLLNSSYWYKVSSLYLSDESKSKSFSISVIPDCKPLKESELEVIQKTRNALAHGNFKTTHEIYDIKNDIYNNDEIIIQRICEMLVYAYVFLYRLTYSLYIKKTTNNRKEIITGEDLIKHICEISMYKNPELHTYPTKNKIV